MNIKIQNKTGQGGWILKWIIIIIAIILILSYFGFDLKEFLNSESTIANWNYLKDFLYNFWINYIKEYVYFVYEYAKFIIDITWEAIKADIFPA